MFHLKNKIISKIVIFAIIAMLILWLLPAGLISAEGANSIAELQAAADSANTTLAELQAAADSANTTLAEAQAAADSANAALSEAQAALDDANTNLANAQTGGVEEEIALAQASVDSAVSALTEAQTAADAANTALVDAQAAAGVAGATLVDAQTAADAANTALAAALNQGNSEEDPIIEPPQEQPTGNVVLKPIISTDKEDYSPEETVIITGTGFAQNAIYTIVVTRPDGSVVIGDGSFTPGSDKVITDASGNFTPPYNYILDGIMGTYVIEAIDEAGAVVATKTFTDCVYGYIQLTKTGLAEGITAGFTLYDKDNNDCGYREITGVASGNPDPFATWGTSEHKIPSDKGPYKIVETSIPIGYNKMPDITGINITSNDQTVSVTGTNTIKLGKVIITKSGLEHGSGWKDKVKFILDGPNSLHYEQILDHDSSGTYPNSVTWDNLPLGNYTLTESYDGLGNHYAYSSDFTSPTSFTIDSSNTLFTYNVVNCKIVGRVYIHKTGLEWDYWWRDYAVFTLTGPAGPDSQTRTVELDNCWWTFGDDHEKTWGNLPPGTYTLNESYPGGNHFDYSSNYSFPITFDIAAGSTNHEFYVVNSQNCNGSVIVSKVVQDPLGNPIITDTHNFQVSLAQGGVTKYGPVSFSYGGPVTIPDVVPGTYDVVETVDGAYLCDVGGPHTVMVASGQVGATVTVTNKQKPGTVIVTKEVQDPTGADTTDTWGTFGFKFDGGTEQNIVDEESITVSSNVIPGPHTVQESSLPSGYTFVSIDSDSANEAFDPQLVKFDVGPGQTITVDITNKQEYGSIEIFKTDAFDGTPLGGSTFQLFKIGSLIQIGGDIVLGSDGYYKWSDLEWGDYIVRELIAPAGYLLVPDVPLTIGFVQRHYSLKDEIADPRIPGLIGITKYYTGTTTPISGMEFYLYEQNSGIGHIFKGKTAANGYLEFTGLPWGIYDIYEVTTGGDILVAGNIPINAVNLTNYKTIYNPVPGGGTTTLTVAGLTAGTLQVLAFTGIDPIIPISGGSAVIAGIAMLLATLRRRVNRKEVQSSDKG